MKLHDFQKALLFKAELSENRKARSCYRDCVNMSGAKAYQLRAEGIFSDAAAIRATANYQLTRFGAPKRY